jgi:hypothetical protein
MWSATWPVLATLALGGAGWFVASFFAKPLLDFLTLRSQVHEEILFTANVGPITAHRTADHERAADSLRRLGARMKAMDASVRTPLAQAWLLSLAQAPLRCFLSSLGFDLATAGDGLIGLSNALTAVGRPLHVDKIEVALKLPRSSTDDYLQDVREQMREPHS